MWIYMKARGARKMHNILQSTCNFFQRRRRCFPGESVRCTLEACLRHSPPQRYPPPPPKHSSSHKLHPTYPAKPPPSAASVHPPVVLGLPRNLPSLSFSRSRFTPALPIPEPLVPSPCPLSASSTIFISAPGPPRSQPAPALTEATASTGSMKRSGSNRRAALGSCSTGSDTCE
jgi:hypothetical protein